MSSVKEAVGDADTKLAQPPKYLVLLHNDDYTTMEFVLEVLQKFFNKTHDEAMAVMLKVHIEGRGVAGIYNRQIAETKAFQVMELAKTRGFPLKCTVEAEAL